MRVVRIYILREPDTGCVRYVGQTRKRLKSRMGNHWTDALVRGVKDHRCNWLRKLHARGLSPLMQVLVAVDELRANQVEMKWIRILRERGCRLVNGTDGGFGARGVVVSQETREKQRQAKLGTKASPETRRRLSEAHKGRVHSAEARRKMSESHKGKRFMATRRANMSAAQKGKHHTRKTIEKVRQKAIEREAKKAFVSLAAVLLKDKLDLQK